MNKLKPFSIVKTILSHSSFYYYFTLHKCWNYLKTKRITLLWSQGRFHTYNNFWEEPLLLSLKHSYLLVLQMSHQIKSISNLGTILTYKFILGFKGFLKLSIQMLLLHQYYWPLSKFEILMFKLIFIWHNFIVFQLLRML